MPQLSAALNNSTKYSSTRLAPTEVLYKFKVKEPLDLLNIENLRLENLIKAPTPTLQKAAQDTATTSQTPSLPKTPATVLAPSQQRAIAVRIPLRQPSATPTSNTAIVTQAFSSDQYNDGPSYRPEHIDAQNALAFTSIKMKKYYDAKHKPIFFNIKDYVHLRLHRGYQIADI